MQNAKVKMQTAIERRANEPSCRVFTVLFAFCILDFALHGAVGLTGNAECRIHTATERRDNWVHCCAFNFCLHFAF
jgi:hypothetical protein